MKIQALAFSSVLKTRKGYRKRHRHESHEDSHDHLLPNDTVIEILSRLPAKDVLVCRSVCRQWKELISTQTFAEMHLNHARNNINPMFVLHLDGESLVLLIDIATPPPVNARNNVCRTLTFALTKRIDYYGFKLPGVHSNSRRALRFVLSNPVHKYCERFHSSCDGLILLTGGKSLTHVIVFNPITGEKLEILSPSRSHRGEILDSEIFGMFFHPLLKEYCTLWGLRLKNGGGIQLRMLNLGSKPYWKKIKSDTPLLQKKQPFCQRFVPRIIVDDVLYWMYAYDKDDQVRSDPFRSNTYCKCIMAFDIKKEEFLVLSYPEAPTETDMNLRRDLLKMDGFLSLVKLSHNGKINIKIWILKDSKEKTWIRTHTIDLDADIFPKNKSCSKYSCILFDDGEVLDEYSPIKGLRAVEIVNGELIITLSKWLNSNEEVYFYACNLKSGTARKKGRIKAYYSSLSLYAATLVSLPRNSESKIWMHDDNS